MKEEKEEEEKLWAIEEKRKRRNNEIDEGTNERYLFLGELYSMPFRFSADVRIYQDYSLSTVLTLEKLNLSSIKRRNLFRHLLSLYFYLFLPLFII